jgi:hypothetical protein
VKRGSCRYSVEPSTPLDSNSERHLALNPVPEKQQNPLCQYFVASHSLSSRHLSLSCPDLERTHPMSTTETQDANATTPLRRHVRFSRQPSYAGSGAIVEIDRPVEGPQETVRMFTNTLGLLHNSQDDIHGVEIPRTPLLDDISIIKEVRHEGPDGLPENDPWERTLDGRVRYAQHAFIEEYNSIDGGGPNRLPSRSASPRDGPGRRHHTRTASHLSATLGAVGLWVPGSANSRRSSIATLPLHTVCPPPPDRARLLLPEDTVATDLGGNLSPTLSEDSPMVATPPSQRRIELVHPTPPTLQKCPTDLENLPLPANPPPVTPSDWNLTRPFGSILTNLGPHSEKSLGKFPISERDGLSSAGIEFANPFFGRDISTSAHEHPLKNSSVPPSPPVPNPDDMHIHDPLREATQESMDIDFQPPTSPLNSTHPMAQSTPRSILRRPSITNLRPRSHRRRSSTLRPDRSPCSLRSPRLGAAPPLPSLPPLPADRSNDPTANTIPVPRSPLSKPCPLNGLTLIQLLSHLAPDTPARSYAEDDVSSGLDANLTRTHTSSRSTLGSTAPQRTHASSQDNRPGIQTGSIEDPIFLTADELSAPPTVLGGPLFDSPLFDLTDSPAAIVFPPTAPLQHVNEVLLLTRSDTLLVRDDERMLEHARIGVENAYAVYNQLSDEITEHFSSALSQTEVSVIHELEEECLAVLKTLEQCQTMLDLRLTENSIVKDSWSSRTTDWYKQHMRRASTLHLVLSRLAGTVYNEDLLAASPSAVLVKLRAYRRKLDDVSKKMTCAFLRLRVKSLHDTLTTRHQQDREQRRAQTLAALDPQGCGVTSSIDKSNTDKPKAEVYSKQQRAEERAWRHSQRNEINNTLEELSRRTRRSPPTVH